MAKTQFCISGFASIFRLILLALLIVGALSYFAPAQMTQPAILIALATCFVYGMSDWLLSYLLGFACNCSQHRP